MLCLGASAQKRVPYTVNMKSDLLTCSSVCPAHGQGGFNVRCVFQLCANILQTSWYDLI